MAEKRMKVIINKEGNIKVETLSGFLETDCTTTVDEVMAAVSGANMTDSGDKEPERFSDDLTVFVK